MPDDPSLIGQHQNDSAGARNNVHFEDTYSRVGLGIISTLAIDKLGKTHEGLYACQNGVISADNGTNEVNVTWL